MTKTSSDTWNDRLEATVYTCSSPEVAKEVHKLMKSIDDDDTLMARVNKSSQLNLEVKSAKFLKGDNDIIDSISWVAGMTKDFKHGNSTVFVNVKQKNPDHSRNRLKKQGLVTADYQGFLEKEWIESLRAKYPVKINQEVVDSIIK